MIVLGAYLKYLDGNWMYNAISFHTMIDHWELTLWYLTHILIVGAMLISNKNYFN